MEILLTINMKIPLVLFELHTFNSSFRIQRRLWKIYYNKRFKYKTDEITNRF